MPREVRDPEGTTWSCVQAYAGLSNDAEKQEAARVEGSDLIHVVCTPTGGAQSVRLQLNPDWEERLSDEDLVQRIQEAQD